MKANIKNWSEHNLVFPNRKDMGCVFPKVPCKSREIPKSELLAARWCHLWRDTEPNNRAFLCVWYISDLHSNGLCLFNIMFTYFTTPVQPLTCNIVEECLPCQR